MEDYKELEKHIREQGNTDYIDCMFEACERVGLKEVVIYSDGRQDYHGEMDIHVEAKLNDVDFYYYLRQDYGSCSHCDWIESVGEEEITTEYVKYLKEAMEDLK